MLSRRTILALSTTVTLLLYTAVLLLAPRIVMLESDRLAVRMPTRFRVEFLETPRETPARERRREGIPPPAVESLLGDAPGTLPIEDASAAPPLDTPRLEERLTGEAIDRAYDLAPEDDRIYKMDARILEIAEEVARRDIAVTRHLVRPSPDYVLPESALPALRSRDIGPHQIALEPAGIGAGLLVQAIPMTEADADDTMGSEAPPFEAAAFDTPPEAAAAPVAGRLEQELLDIPVAREAARIQQASAYEFMDDMVEIRLHTYLPSNDEPGYFRLRIAPRQDYAVPSLPRDIIFVVDASRSIQQRKLDLVGRGISDAISRFQPEDKFNILLFRDTATMFQTDATPATPENIAAAQRFLSDIDAYGRTDIYNALVPMAQRTPRSNLPGIILVVSDGVPTTGLRDSRAIINAVTADNALRNSIFTYGAGSAVNRYLLDLLAYRNKGEAFVSDSIHDARDELRSFIDSLGYPLLVNLKADYGQIDHNNIFPRILPDFYLQKPVTVYGRFDPDNNTTFVARITGNAKDDVKEMVFRADFTQAERAGVEIAQAWAFQKAYHIIGEMSLRGEQPELIAQLRQLSQRYNIRTIYDE